MSSILKNNIGDEIKFNDVILIVEEDNGLGWCQGCYFSCGYDDDDNREPCFPCMPYQRTDNKDVIFKLKGND